MSRERPDQLESFDDFFIRFYPAAFRVARRLLGDRHAAEDVAAEAFARAYAHWRTIGETSYREPWVIRVTTNLALSSLRRKVPSPGPTHSIEAADNAATRVALVAALRQLPKRQREVIVLRHLVGFSEQETCATLGIAVTTVRTHLERALRSLKVELVDDDGSRMLDVH